MKIPRKKSDLYKLLSIPFGYIWAWCLAQAIKAWIKEQKNAR